ncbi:substrate-binding domain-containing protein, partial [Clostridium butyricum]
LLKSIKSYGKALFIGEDGAEAGRLQGKIINEAWKYKEKFDKNNDNVFQYILIKGEKNNVETQLRSKYVIMSLNEYGINTLEVASEYCNWDKDYAKLVVKSLFLRYGNVIEGIICNNDEMAEGSIEALHEFGYNMGNLNNNNVIVVGIDGLDEALELIKKKEMTGTVVQNIDEMAKALYLVGNNLVQGKDPLYNTKYKFDSSGVAIRIPYSGYVVSKF